MKAKKKTVAVPYTKPAVQFAEAYQDHVKAQGCTIDTAETKAILDKIAKAFRVKTKGWVGSPITVAQRRQMAETMARLMPVPPVSVQATANPHVKDRIDVSLELPTAGVSGDTLRRLLQLDSGRKEDYLPDFVLTSDGKLRGQATGSYKRCTLEGCTGRRIHVRWPDGHRTWPCTKGMEIVSWEPGNRVLKIMK